MLGLNILIAELIMFRFYLIWMFSSCSL